MARYTGTVRKNDLSGGFWELHADDGTVYQLSGDDDGLHYDGKRFVIEGKVDQNLMGIGMTGPTLVVSGYQPG